MNLDPYPKNMLYDINAGHWDLYGNGGDSLDSDYLKLSKAIMVRNPLSDVKHGTIAIDFGTKSTTAAILDENNQKQLLRIGGGSYKKAEHKNDYENPTIIEFVNIVKFMGAYHKAKSRPLTSWDDICVSHTANNHLAESGNDDFYRFFSSLKQWARSSGKNINIKDKEEIVSLKDFLECGKKDVNPIEIYAYYIGRYINNMTRGIYLEYLLSFPTKYKKEVRDKIQESFELGIKKSIPSLVLAQHEVSVKLQASEPAAYAISALKEYGFATGKLNEVIHYGVFDFGGGTTDFDFGIWKKSENRRYDFEITHFGAGGDQYLGGENLLERLAFEVFKDNQEVMREHECSFLKPDNMSSFGGSESLISTSSEARKNTSVLVEMLRPIWENVSLLSADDANELIDDSSIKEKIQNIKSGTINVQLVDNGLKPISINLSVDANKLVDVLKKEIERGVENFLHSFKNVAGKMQDLQKLRIFLGGNSSRSPLVKECFEEMIKGESEKSREASQFEFFPPLGTPEAREKKKELGLSIVDEQDLSKAITCKTGVVFGLLDSRKGSKINVISEIDQDDEAKFEFYLGMERYGNFETILEVNNLEVGNEKWHELFDYADEIEYEIFYTADARATSNEIPIGEVKRMKIRLDKKYGERDRVKVQMVDTDKIIYEVFDEKDQKLSNINKIIQFSR